MKDSGENIRVVFVIAALAVLFYAVFATLRPFFEPIAWAGILVITTWRLFQKLERRLPGRPKLAAFLMTVLLALVVLVAVVPLLIAIRNEIDSMSANVRTAVQSEKFRLPPRIGALPVVGQPLQDKVRQIREGDATALTNALFGQERRLINFAAQAAQGIAIVALGFLMCLFTTFFLYTHGDQLRHQIMLGARRMGGERFERLIEAVRQTLHGALYGVAATALAQGVLATAGFLAFGAPTPLTLGLATVVFSLIPFGAPLVYLPAAAFIASEGRFGAAALMAVWGLGVVSTADNVLRPFFISQTTKTSLILVFMGVVGGILAFGPIGIFLGPAVISVAEVLWLEWVGEQHLLEREKQERIGLP